MYSLNAFPESKVYLMELVCSLTRPSYIACSSSNPEGISFDTKTGQIHIEAIRHVPMEESSGQTVGGLFSQNLFIDCHSESAFGMRTFLLLMIRTRPHSEHDHTLNTPIVFFRACFITEACLTVEAWLILEGRPYN